jgi:hypothetical protein
MLRVGFHSDVTAVYSLGIGTDVRICCTNAVLTSIALALVAPSTAAILLCANEHQVYPPHAIVWAVLLLC